MKEEKYFVYNKGKGIPTFEHKSFESALDEAKRLAKKEDCYFMVLKAEALVEPVTHFDMTLWR